MSRSADLRAKIALLSPAMQSAATALWTHEGFRDLYPHFLRTLHATMRGSGPLIQYAADESTRLARATGDSVATKLAEYFEHHAKEEVGHDLWVLEDLENLGIPREEVLATPPPSHAAELVGAQYYYVRAWHPVALLGYIAVAERPFDPDYYRNLASKHSLPESAFKALILHAELDAHHCADLDRIVDELDLSPAQENLLGTSAIYSAGATANLFRRVVADFERQQAHAKATSSL